MLIKEEIQNDSSSGKNLDERLKKIENTLYLNHPFTNQTPIEDSANSLNADNHKDLPDYYYPSGLSNYLFNYNQNIILKSTCHEIDSDELNYINEYCETQIYDYEKHLQKVIEAFKIHDENHFAPAHVKSLIRGYLTGKDYNGKPIIGWSSQNFKINWSCKAIKDWCQMNPGIPPNPDGGYRKQERKSGFEIDPNISLNNKTVIQKFSDLVIHFKYLFHIRSSNPLKKIIGNENSSKKWDEKIDFEIDDSDFPINIEFFTDVDKLIQAYNRIIELIIEQHTNMNKNTKPKVQLTLFEKNESIEFSILHKDCVYGKSIKNATERLGGSYKNLIKKQINGLCDFYVRADFENDDPYCFGIWDKKELWKTEYPEAKILKKAVGGVEHIFQIPKPKIKK